MKTLDDMAAARPRRSLAWIWYAILAVGALVLTFQHVAAIFLALGCAAYSRYIYRGGSIVIWFW